MTRDTQELVEAVRKALNSRPLTYQQNYVAADAALTELAERERRNAALAGSRLEEIFQLKHRAETAERDLASSQAAALLLHRKMEELQRALDGCRELTGDVLDGERRAEAAEAQLAERDKRIEGLREALERIRDLSSQEVQFASVGGEGGVMRKIARAALADPVVVPERECTCAFGPRLAYKWGDHHQEGCPMREAPAVVVPGWEWDFKQEC